MINRRLNKILCRHCSEEQLQRIVEDINAMYGTPTKIERAQDVLDVVANIFEGADKESMWALLLTRSNHVIDVIQIGHGTERNTVVSVKTLAKLALNTDGCCAVILVHNHPSGTQEASLADISITREIREVLSRLDVQVFDHIIYCGRDEYYSFAENHML